MFLEKILEIQKIKSGKFLPIELNYYICRARTRNANTAAVK